VSDNGWCELYWIECYRTGPNSWERVVHGGDNTTGWAWVELECQPESYEGANDGYIKIYGGGHAEWDLSYAPVGYCTFTFSKQINGSGKFNCYVGSKYLCDIDSLEGGNNYGLEVPAVDEAYIKFITCPS
jgi:hypothetical protein